MVPVDPAEFDAANDWPWWRGPARDGKAGGDHSYPTEWSESKNVIWQADVPGHGLASPIVVGKRVFLATADASKQVQSVLCYDRDTGDRLWRKDVHQGKLGSAGHNDNTHASSTPACDGRRVFAVFRKEGRIVVTALSVDKGTQLWRTDVGAHNATHGYGASPVIHKELVIVAADSSGGFIAALHRKNGKIWWRKNRGRGESYATPVVAHIAGRDQLLLSGGQRVDSYDPMTGNPYWSVKAVSQSACGTIVWKDDVVFASGGYPQKQTVAIKADDSEEVRWKSREAFYVASMIVAGDRLFGFHERNSTAFVFDTNDGRIVKRLRLSRGYYGSPVLAGGHIYAPGRNGTVDVLDPQTGRTVASNRLGDGMDSTPTPAGGKLFLRVTHGGRDVLYCIGNT